MSKATRTTLIKRIEKARQSRVIAYCTSDRALSGAPSGQISEDAIRPLHDLLRRMGRQQRIDLFLYTRGGAVDVPWRIVSALRQYAKEWHCLVPFRAHSAGTMIAMGADSIVMGLQGELGPIDPSVSFVRPGGNTQDSVSVEDVMAFVTFVRKECGTNSDAQVLTDAILRLLERVDAVLLGRIYRNHAHIRDVAQRILRSRSRAFGHRPNTAIEKRIVSTLAERVYAHGHAISYGEALKIGLPVSEAPVGLEGDMWKLFQQYEEMLQLRSPLDPATLTAKKDPATEKTILALLETSDGIFTHSAQLEVRAKRQLPQNFNPQLAITVKFPDNFDPAQLTAEAQKLVATIANDAAEQLKRESGKILLAALKAESPAQGYEISARKAGWKEL